MCTTKPVSRRLDRPKPIKFLPLARRLTLRLVGDLRLLFCYRDSLVAPELSHLYRPPSPISSAYEHRRLILNGLSGHYCVL